MTGPYDALIIGAGPAGLSAAARLGATGARILLIDENPRPGGQYYRDVLEVAEASPLARSFGFGLRAWHAPLMALEGAGFWARLFTGRARFRFGWQVIAAEGNERLEAVTLAPLTPNGIDRSRAHRIACDTLCISHTLIPGTDIARLVSAATTIDPVSGAAVPDAGPFLETSVPGLFVAGEAAGIGGGPVAEAEGTLAALGLALHLQKLDPGTAEAEAALLRRTIAPRRRIVRDMFRTYAPPAALTAAIADDTIVCRCEEVTAGEIRSTCRAGDTDADIVKSRTRAGMGYCQGRMCGPTVQRLMAAAAGGAPLPTPFKPRAPLKPLPVAELVATRHVGT